MSSSKSGLTRRPKAKAIRIADEPIASARGTTARKGEVLPGFFRPNAEALRYWRARSELISRAKAGGRAA
jgi:hypothetical protein